MWLFATEMSVTLLDIVSTQKKNQKKHAIYLLKSQSIILYSKKLQLNKKTQTVKSRCVMSSSLAYVTNGSQKNKLAGDTE